MGVGVGDRHPRALRSDGLQAHRLGWGGSQSCDGAAFSTKPSYIVMPHLPQLGSSLLDLYGIDPNIPLLPPLTSLKSGYILQLQLHFFFLGGT